MDLHAINVWTHIGAGALALAIGLISLGTRKGGAVHRRAGRIFVGFAAVVIGTAIVGVVFFAPPPALIAATLAAGYQYLSSLRALALRDRPPGVVDAVLALAGLAGCAALYFAMNTGTASWPPAIGYSTIGYISCLALYDLSRHAWGPAWLAHVRPLDHGLKMTGAYFAMASAGIGNVFRDYQPWSQLGPSMLGFAVMIALTAAHIGRAPRIARAPA